MTPLKRKDNSLSSVTKVARREDILKRWDYTGCEIAHCQFDECDLSGSVWQNQSIHHSSFKRSVIDHTSLHHVTIEASYVALTSFDYSQLDTVHFDHCHFFRTSFNALIACQHIIMNNCHVQQVLMLGGVKALNVVIKHHVQTEIDLLTDKQIMIEGGYKSAFKPKVLGIWNNANPLTSATLTEQMLSSKGMHPVRMDLLVPINEALLDEEINQLNMMVKHRWVSLKEKVWARMRQTPTSQALPMQDLVLLFDSIWKKEGISFPLLMIQTMREEHENNPDKFTQMAALYQHATIFFDKVDGIMLTGGQDMDPRFYGESLHPQTGLPPYTPPSSFTDPRRDIIEFSLIYMQQRASAPKPLCGICRGSQVIAAAYGATIYQELDSPERRQYFVEAIQPKAIEKNVQIASYSTKATLKNSVKNQKALNVMFMHHQGYDLSHAHGLEASASTKTSGGKTIDIIGEHLSQNITFTQAHLEYYVDKQEGTQDGFAPHVSKHMADEVFQQFEKRIEAYCHSRQYNTLKALSIFTPKDNGAKSLKDAPTRQNTPML